MCPCSRSLHDPTQSLRSLCASQLEAYRNYVLQFVSTALGGPEDIVRAWNRVLVNCGSDPISTPENGGDNVGAASNDTLGMLQQLQKLVVAKPSQNVSPTGKGNPKGYTDVLGLLGMKEQAEKIEVEGGAKAVSATPKKVASNPNLINMQKAASKIIEEHPSVCLFRNLRFARLIETILKKSKHSPDVSKAKYPR